ncbi:MAG: hypothetical protein RMJ84_04415 [Sandaracinaceae bacterium]|nr:hypothetical protein [Sandaracinaceae bacterium]
MQARVSKNKDDALKREGVQSRGSVGKEVRRQCGGVPALLMCLVIWGEGCGNINSPIIINRRDGGPTQLDQDHDGLCDNGEAVRGTDPRKEDTDGDGFADGVEAYLGSNPLRIDSPERRQLVVLFAEPGARTTTAFTFAVNANGENYVGAFTSSPSPIDGGSAFMFLEGAKALFAIPMDGVERVEGERFSGVVGQVLLHFQVNFAYKVSSPSPCMLAYPFGYAVKSEGGAGLEEAKRFLVVAPTDQSPGMGTWCKPSRCFD